MVLREYSMIFLCFITTSAKILGPCAQDGGRTHEVMGVNTHVPGRSMWRCVGYGTLNPLIDHHFPYEIILSNIQWPQLGVPYFQTNPCVSFTFLGPYHKI